MSEWLKRLEQEGLLAGPTLAVDRSEGEPALLEMRMSEFATSGLTQKVYSRVLEETILWAADNAVVPDDGPLVVYRALELAHLVGKTPDEIRVIHMVKKELDGEIISEEDI